MPVAFNQFLYETVKMLRAAKLPVALLPARRSGVSKALVNMQKESDAAPGTQIWQTPREDTAGTGAACNTGPSRLAGGGFIKITGTCGGKEYDDIRDVRWLSQPTEGRPVRSFLSPRDITLVGNTAQWLW